MITSTPSIERRSGLRARQLRAFTLVEVIAATTLSLIVLAGILAAFLMIGRTEFNSGSYSIAEAEVRRGLDTFAEDVRQASDIHWNSDQSITLMVPTATDATQLVTYAYDADPSSKTNGCFYRLLGAADSPAPKIILVHGVAPDFAFHRYKLELPGAVDNTAANDMETKQIQLNLRAVRTGITTVTATQAAISANFILRNKRVSD